MENWKNPEKNTKCEIKQFSGIFRSKSVFYTSLFYVIVRLYIQFYQLFNNMLGTLSIIKENGYMNMDILTQSLTVGHLDYFCLSNYK